MNPDPGPRYIRQSRLEELRAGDGEARITRASALIVGCGALGTCSAEFLARAGIRELRLVDRDIVDVSNLPRQIAFTEADAREGAPKAEALATHLRAIRSDLELVVAAEELDASNARRHASGVDVILDGTDNVATRVLLNELSFALRVPWVYAGAVGTRGHAMVVSGVRGPCLRCYLEEIPPPGSLPTCETVGVLGSVVGVIASWQATLALRVLAEGNVSGDLSGRLLRLDPWRLDSRVTRVPPRPDCPVCVARRFETLERKTARGAVARLCGRDSVQVRPMHPAPVDLQAIASRLGADCVRELRPSCLRVELESQRVTVFADGRALFDGLTDPERARSLYARFIGE